MGIRPLPPEGQNMWHATWPRALLEVGTISQRNLLCRLGAQDLGGAKKLLITPSAAPLNHVAEGTAGGGHHFTEKSVAQTRGTGFGCSQKTVNHTLCSPSKHMIPNHHLPWWGTRTPTGAVSAL